MAIAGEVHARGTLVDVRVRAGQRGEDGALPVCPRLMLQLRAPTGPILYVGKLQS